MDTRADELWRLEVDGRQTKQASPQPKPDPGHTTPPTAAEEDLRQTPVEHGYGHGV